MNNPEFNDIDPAYAEARRTLHSSVENIDYLAYAVGKGPLLLSEIDPSLRQNDAFQETIGAYGWPSAMEDGIIEPTKDYGSSRDFLVSMKPVDVHGPRHITSDHFLTLVSQPVIRTFSEARTGNGFYGILPYLHRGHAVAPDLFDSLQKSLQKLYERYAIISYQDEMYTELLKDQNADVVEAMYMAYHILGRLIKVNDLDTVIGNHHESTNSSKPILSADVALRRGNISKAG